MWYYFFCEHDLNTHKNDIYTGCGFLTQILGKNQNFLKISIETGFFSRIPKMEICFFSSTLLSLLVRKKMIWGSMTYYESLWCQLFMFKSAIIFEKSSFWRKIWSILSVSLCKISTVLRILSNFNWWFYKMVYNFWQKRDFLEIPSNLSFSDPSGTAWDTSVSNIFSFYFKLIFQKKKKEEKKTLFFE